MWASSAQLQFLACHRWRITNLLSKRCVRLLRGNIEKNHARGVEASSTPLDTYFYESSLIGYRWRTPQRVSSTGIKAAKSDTRVFAACFPARQASKRITLMAAAVKRCERAVFGNPKYRVRRSPSERTACELVSSMPDRRAYRV